MYHGTVQQSPCEKPRLESVGIPIASRPVEGCEIPYVVIRNFVRKYRRRCTARKIGVRTGRIDDTCVNPLPDPTRKTQSAWFRNDDVGTQLELDVATYSVSRTPMRIALCYSRSHSAFQKWLRIEQPPDLILFLRIKMNSMLTIDLFY